MLYYTVTDDGIKQLKNIQVQDMLLTHNKHFKPVLYKSEEKHKEVIVIEVEDGDRIVCSPNHKWIVNRNGVRTEVLAQDINKETDELIKLRGSLTTIYHCGKKTVTFYTKPPYELIKL